MSVRTSRSGRCSVGRMATYQPKFVLSARGVGGSEGTNREWRAST